MSCRQIKLYKLYMLQVKTSYSSGERGYLTQSEILSLVQYIIITWYITVQIIQ